MDSQSSVITFSGLASGLDTSSVVDALVKVARDPINKVDKKKQISQKHEQLIKGIRDELLKAGQTATALDDLPSLRKMQAESSDSTKVAVATGTGAVATAFDLTVNQLARAHRSYSDAFAQRDAAGLFGTGTIAITQGAGSPVTITVTNTTTLEDIADSINYSSLDLRASILYDGSQYRLYLSGQETGASNTFTFTETGTLLGLAEVTNQVASAQNAIFSVDNITNLSRPSNVIADLMPGMTLTLQEAGNTPVHIATSLDLEATTDEVAKAIEQYNKVISAVTNAITFKGTPDPEKLVGDSTLQFLLQSLRRASGDTVANATGSFSSLVAVGIKTGQDGLLEMDRDTFKTHLATDPDGLLSLLTSDVTANRKGVMGKLAELADSYGLPLTGILSNRINSFEQIQKSLDQRKQYLEIYVKNYESSLKRKFSDLERTLSQTKTSGAMAGQPGVMQRY